MKVQKTSTCWIWTAAVNNCGYGLFGSPKRTTHRVALELAGVEIPEGYCGLHKCNNTRCVRVHPDHVYVGTLKQNQKDRNGWGTRRLKHTWELCDRNGVNDVK